MKLVLIINPESVWTTGVESLLEHIPDLQVSTVHINCECDLIHEIERLQPDVVIWDEAQDVARLCDMTALLNKLPRLGIFVVSIYDNLVHIYSKREIQVKHAADLITEIRQML